MEINSTAVLRALLCCGCQEYLYAPIIQCTGGHSICGHCFLMGMQICPECNSEIGCNRNITLESIISLLKFPCKYMSAGCQVSDSAFKIRDHQEHCNYGEIKCPLNESNKCQWVGKIKDLLHHAENHHDSSTKNIKKYNIKEISLYPDTAKEVSTHFGLINAFSKVFKYGIRFNFRPSTVQVLYMQVGGCPYDAYKYSCVTTLNRDCSITSQCHRLMGDQTAFTMTSGNSVYIDKLKESCIFNKLFRIQILIVFTKDLENGLLNENDLSFNTVKCSKHKRRRVTFHSDSDSD